MKIEIATAVYNNDLWNAMKYMNYKCHFIFFIQDDEDDDVDETDGKPVENVSDFPQIKSNVEQLESERYTVTVIFC